MTLLLADWQQIPFKALVARVCLCERIKHNPGLHDDDINVTWLVARARAAE